MSSIASEKRSSDLKTTLKLRESPKTCNQKLQKQTTKSGKKRTNRDSVQNWKANVFGFSLVDCGADRKSERQSGKTRPARMPLAIDMTEKKTGKPVNCATLEASCRYLWLLRNWGFEEFTASDFG